MARRELNWWKEEYPKLDFKLKNGKKLRQTKLNEYGTYKEVRADGKKQKKHH